MKSIKMLFVVASMYLLSCSSNASGTSPTKNATIGQYEGIVNDAVMEMDVLQITYIAPEEFLVVNGSYGISRSETQFKPKFTAPGGYLAILNPPGKELKCPPKLLICLKIGTPDTKRHFKYLFERQKVC